MTTLIDTSRSTQSCPTCDGHGKTRNSWGERVNVCNRCDGEGKVSYSVALRAAARLVFISGALAFLGAIAFGMYEWKDTYYGHPGHRHGEFMWPIGHVNSVLGMLVIGLGWLLAAVGVIAVVVGIVMSILWLWDQTGW